MNLLTIHQIVKMENEILKSQAILRKNKVNEETEKDKLKMQIIKLNGKINSELAKIGRVK